MRKELTSSVFPNLANDTLYLRCSKVKPQSIFYSTFLHHPHPINQQTLLTFDLTLLNRWHICSIIFISTMVIKSQVPNSGTLWCMFLTSLSASTCTFLQSIFYSWHDFLKMCTKCLYLKPFKGSLLHNKIYPTLKIL